MSILDEQIHPLLLKTYTIVIPAYNEENRIGKVLDEVCMFISTNKLPWEVIVAVDGSDHTNDIIEKYHKQYSFVSSKKSLGRSGMGGAIKRGIVSSHCEFTIMMDADGSAKLLDMIENIELLESYEVLNFNRYSSTKNFIPFKRRLASRVFNLILKALFNINIYDTQCGYKIMKTKEAAKIVKKITFTNGFFLTAFFLHCKKSGIKVTEVPLNYNHTEGSKFNVIMTSISYIISIMAFWLTNSRLNRFIPISLSQLYYRKFKYL